MSMKYMQSAYIHFVKCKYRSGLLFVFVMKRVYLLQQTTVGPKIKSTRCEAAASWCVPSIHLSRQPGCSLGYHLAL
jgi:hypothetical protein